MIKKKNAGLAPVAKKGKKAKSGAMAKVAKVTGGKRVARTYSQPGAVKTKHGIKGNIPEMQ